jgi:DNA-binding MarR family transcriptional regulator
VSLILAPAPPPEESTAEGLLRAAEEIARAFELHAQGRFGLSRTRLGLLLLLEGSTEPGGHRAGEIAERLGLTRPSVTALLDGLESDGLVTRRTDPTDRRARRVLLTTKGRARARAARPVHVRRLAALTRALSEEERERLAELLDKVRADLGALSGP